MPEVTVAKAVAEAGYTLTCAQARRYIQMGIVFKNEKKVCDVHATCAQGDVIEIRTKKGVKSLTVE